MKNETERLKALREYEILDTEAERALDKISQIASQVCGTKIALISLIDENRQWFKSKIGVDICQTSRDVAFCNHAILEDEILIVEDAKADPRFCNNPFVTNEPNLRFYAGAVLKTPEGLHIGTLCVADSEPKIMTSTQIDTLISLASFVVSHFELKKKSKLLLREEIRNKQINEVINAMPDFIGTCDLDGNILFYNDAFAQNSMITGTNHIFQYYPKWVKKMMDETAIPHAVENDIWRGKSVVLLNNGKELDIFQTIICHRDEFGYPAYFSTVMQDLSGIKLKIISEEERFIANMSHEIRTPLNAILGHTDLLAESLSDKKQLNHIVAVKKSGEVLLNLINDFLDISRFDKGHLQLQNKSFSFQEIGDKLNHLFSYEFSKKKVKFNINIDEKLGTFSGDTIRIKQILIKLIGNALEHTTSGHITLNISANNTKKSGNVLVSVSDSGIGIDKEKQEIIFENNKTGVNTLGLSIVKNLVQLMNGAIWVESVTGQGSVFSFTLGLEETAPETAKPKALNVEESLLDKRLSILVVDDSIENITLIKAYLKKFSFDIEIAENGELALEKLKAKHFDLVFMDIQMPVMDGLTATKIFRLWEKDNSKGHVPIAALTALSLQEDQANSLNAGCDVHLTKPVKKDTILQTINKFAQGNNTVEP